MKEEVVRKFLQKGRLLSPDILEKLVSGQIDETMVLYDDLVITNARQKDKEEFTILKNITKKKEEASAEDFAKFYRSKYEKTVSILATRLQKDFISLNKVDNFRNEIYVTGIVKDVQKKDEKFIIELEDLTGSGKIVFDGEQDVDLDDVVAVRCVSAGNILFGKQIIYPDVPLRQPKTGSGSACFISGLNLHEAAKQDAEKFFRWFSEQHADLLFVAGDIGDKDVFEKYVNIYCSQKTIFVIPGNKDKDEEYPQTPIIFDNKNIVSISNPGMVEVNGLVILLIHNFNTDMLKKRYLGRSKCIMDEDELVLDITPDIVCHSAADSQVTNYKSITMVTSGSLLADFRPVVIDFGTREAQQNKIE
ncbi:MAG: metallophosphoesterase [Candidatus Aenigmarchaeota archaeon]|nr:metallophosphoesterase [Candidatus Aenigmarchaeota archaeon]